MKHGETYMEQDFRSYRLKLYDQIEEAYAKVVYTYTVQHKQAEIIAKRNSRLKITQIVLSAITSCGLLAVLLGACESLNKLNAVLSTVTFALSYYLSIANLDVQELNHLATANSLWVLRERYLSILTDFEVLSSEDIIKKRDELMIEVAKIYDSAPKTSDDAYEKAQKALKENEEQYFTREEKNKLVPERLRK